MAQSAHAASSKHAWFGSLRVEPARRDLPAPFSCGSQHVDAYTPTADELKRNDDLKVKRAWTVATAPFQSAVLMTGFMLWMMGNSLNIWLIMLTFHALNSPITAIAATNRVFAGFRASSREPLNLLPHKAVYVLLHLVALGIAMYKLRTLGLLPTQWTDVYGFMQTRQPLEHAVRG